MQGFKLNLYEIDSSDNGTLIRTTGTLQTYWSITRKEGYRYLLEADATDSEGYSLDVWWPR